MVVQLKPSSFSCSDSIHWTNGNWSIPIISSLLYLFLVYFGRQWMKSREAFNLKRSLMLWNLATAVFSILGASVCLPAVINSTIEKGFIYTSCISDGYYGSESSVCFWTFLFTVSKVIELGDTFFIILRKKPLVVLHWYHHVSVVYLMWFTFSNAATGISHWASAINYTIHSIMYSYYAATSAGFRFPALIPPLITMLQILQMFFGATINVIAFVYRSTCPVDEAVVWAGVIIVLSYAVLFGNYFVQRYVLKKKKKE
uniref:Elongation of very long chain fatty acids protein n=1 Tax=Amphimedon queenslandica TaxID=400682 RepID=A0A1X7VSD7_AMPQE